MPLKYLFGPVSAEYARQHLGGPRQRRECLAFNADGSADLSAGPGDTWQAVASRLPAGWAPDCVFLRLDYTTIPACFWSAPAPVIGLAGDWNLLWHAYRYFLRRCDLVVTDPPGVERFREEGLRHALPGNLYGCGRHYLDRPWPRTRDIDLLFVGNVQPAVQRERLPWVARLARLADRYRVSLRAGVYDEPYRDLLGRSRIVFNRSIRGECNQRVFEAVAAGALLFQEAGNAEVARHLRPGEEYVEYRDDDLERLLARYLADEAERSRIAEAARGRVADFQFDTLWAGIV